MGARIAEERVSRLARWVTRSFTDKTSLKTLVKVMTDGILLAETQNDRFLEQYDMIIDEAPNAVSISFRRLSEAGVAEASGSKVIVTSATIDLERFPTFGNALVVQVSGRTYRLMSSIVRSKNPKLLTWTNSCSGRSSMR